MNNLKEIYHIFVYEYEILFNIYFDDYENQINFIDTKLLRIEKEILDIITTLDLRTLIYIETIINCRCDYLNELCDYEDDDEEEYKIYLLLNRHQVHLDNINNAKNNIASIKIQTKWKEIYQNRNKAILKIQNRWRFVNSNPEYKICKNRLNYEFNNLIN